MTRLTLGGNGALTDLNLENSDFSKLTRFNVAGDASITRVSLKSTVLSQTAVTAIISGGG